MSVIEDTIRAIVREELDLAIEKLAARLQQQRPSDSRATMLTTEEAAQLAKVTIDTVRRWVKEGRLIEHRSGRRLLVSRAELLALVTVPPNNVQAAVAAELRLLNLEEE